MSATTEGALGTVTPARDGRGTATRGLSDVPEDLPVLLDTETAARLAGFSAKFVREHCRLGDIECVRIGREWRIHRDAYLRKLGLA